MSRVTFLTSFSPAYAIICATEAIYVGLLGAPLSNQPNTRSANGRLRTKAMVRSGGCCLTRSMCGCARTSCAATFQAHNPDHPLDNERKSARDVRGSLPSSTVRRDVHNSRGWPPYTPRTAFKTLLQSVRTHLRTFCKLSSPSTVRGLISV